MRGLGIAWVLIFSGMCWAQDAPMNAQERMVSVGDHRLHVVESGSGKQTVVFESGFGEDTNTWNDVLPKIASFARTFAYDRAGLGKSEMLSGARPGRTVQDMVTELHTLLHAAKVSGPYVLVGHSLGGALVQLYAHSYPADVKALVLVDPEDSQLLDLLQSRMTASEWADHQKAVEAALAEMTPGIRAERAVAFKTSGDIVAGASPLPDVPVILLTGTKKNPEFPGNPLEQDLKMELHKKLLSQLRQGKQVLAPNSRHYIQNDQPDLVIEAVREVTR